MDAWEEKTVELADDDIQDVDLSNELRVEEWFAEGELLGLLGSL